MNRKNATIGMLRSIMNQSNCYPVGLARDPAGVHQVTLHREKHQAIWRVTFLVLGNEAYVEGNHQAFLRENFMVSGGQHKVSWKEACVEGNKNKN